MALDFFTLTEMRDGLSSLARVEELLSMIQKLNDCARGNLGDAVRQWSAVASVLAATDNKEYLDQFLHLNGLSFLSHWLQEALKLSADFSGIIVEELINSSLILFERLPVNHKRITASGVQVAIELLLNHKDIPIKEKARILYDKWNLAKEDDISCDLNRSDISQSDKARTSKDVLTSESCVNLVNPIVEGRSEAESSGTEFPVSYVTRCLDSCPLDSTNKERAPTSNQVPSTSLNPSSSNAVFVDVNSSGSSLVSIPCQENLSVIKESTVCCAVGIPSVGTCSQNGYEGNVDDRHNASLSTDNNNIMEEMDVDVREHPCKLNQGDTCDYFAFSASATPSMTTGEPTILCKLDSNNSDFCASKAMEHQPKAGTSDYESEKCLITAKESDPAANLTSGDLSATATILSNMGDPQLSCQREEATSSVIKDLDLEVNLKCRKGQFATSSDILKVVGAKAIKKIGQKSQLGFECLDVALEVARQVAIAVEREVVDYREPFCSSPEVYSGENAGSHSFDSEEEKQDQPMSKEDGGNSSSAVKDHSGRSSPEKGSEITQKVSSDLENSEQDIGSPKPKFPIQESVGKTVMDGYTFDLNLSAWKCPSMCLLL